MTATSASAYDAGTPRRLRRPGWRIVLATAVLAVVLAPVAGALLDAVHGGGQGTAVAQPSAPVVPPGGGAWGGDVLDGIANTYRTAATSWRGRLIPVAQRTFFVLAAIEFAISGTWWALNRQDPEEMAAKFVAKFAVLAGLLTFITSFNFWFPPIINGFVNAGERAIGVAGVATPSSVVSLGGETAMVILRELSLSTIARDPVMALFAALSALIIVLAYCFIAAELLMVMIQSYLVVMGGGVLFLGFAGSRWTAAIAENLIGYAFYVGIKAFLLYLIVAAGMVTARSFVPLIDSNTFSGPLSPLFQVLAGGIVFALVAIRVPNSAAGRLVGHQPFGIAQALRSLA